MSYVINYFKLLLYNLIINDGHYYHLLLTNDDRLKWFKNKIKKLSFSVFHIYFIIYLRFQSNKLNISHSAIVKEMNLKIHNQLLLFILNYDTFRNISFI